MTLRYSLYRTNPDGSREHERLCFSNTWTAMPVVHLDHEYFSQVKSMPIQLVTYSPGQGFNALRNPCARAEELLNGQFTIKNTRW